MFKVDWPGHRWPIGHFLGLSCLLQSTSEISLQSQKAVCLFDWRHSQESSWWQPQQFEFEQEQPIVPRLPSHWCPGEKGSPQFLQMSSLVVRRGELVRDVEKSLWLRRISGVPAAISGLLCFILTCCRSPFSEAALYSHWSHFGFSEAVALSSGIRPEGFCCFLSKNSALRLAFLLSVEGLVLFLTRGPFISLLLVSMEKEKEGPMEMEMLKAWPWLASAWQKSKHLESMGESTMSTPAILVLLLN